MTERILIWALQADCVWKRLLIHPEKLNKDYATTLLRCIRGMVRPKCSRRNRRRRRRRRWWCSRRSVRLILPKGTKTRHNCITLIDREADRADRQSAARATASERGMHTMDDVASLQHNINCRMRVASQHSSVLEATCHHPDVTWCKGRLLIVTTTFCS